MLNLLDNKVEVYIGDDMSNKLWIRKEFLSVRMLIIFKKILKEVANKFKNQDAESIVIFGELNRQFSESKVAFRFSKDIYAGCWIAKRIINGYCLRLCVTLLSIGIINKWCLVMHLEKIEIKKEA